MYQYWQIHLTSQRNPCINSNNCLSEGVTDNKWQWSDLVRWKFIWSVYLRRRISLPILLLDVNIVRDGWCIQRFSPSYLEICAYKINWNSDLQNIFNESICQFCVDKINGKSILQNRYCWSVRDMWSVFGSLEIRLIFNVIIIIIITGEISSDLYRT